MALALFHFLGINIHVVHASKIVSV